MPPGLWHFGYSLVKPVFSHRVRAISLMELLCVLAIISILMAIYLPTISHALTHVKKVLGID